MAELGRPTIYSKEIADIICNRIANGESLRKICEDEGLPEARTVHYWLLDPEKKEFFQQYAKAREIQAEQLFDELLEIADQSSDVIVGDDKSDNARVQSSKLKVDTRKWYLSKVLPKKFGEKVDVTSGGKPTPILQLGIKKNAVLRDDSDKEDCESDE